MTNLHTALPPLANGNSHPAAPLLVHNLRERGHEVDVDVEAMERASAYWQRQARIKRLPAGAPREYDEAYYRHNIPGGVQSTLLRQLGELGRPELFDAVIEEAIAVRRRAAQSVVRPVPRPAASSTSRSRSEAVPWPMTSSPRTGMSIGLFAMGAADPETSGRPLMSQAPQRRRMVMASSERPSVRTVTIVRPDSNSPW